MAIMLSYVSHATCSKKILSVLRHMPTPKPTLSHGNSGPCFYSVAKFANRCVCKMTFLEPQSIVGYCTVEVPVPVVVSGLQSLYAHCACTRQVRASPLAAVLPFGSRYSGASSCLHARCVSEEFRIGAGCIASAEKLPQPRFFLCDTGCRICLLPSCELRSASSHDKYAHMETWTGLVI
jgi:hypothetical protein